MEKEEILKTLLSKQNEKEKALKVLSELDDNEKHKFILDMLINNKLDFSIILLAHLNHLEKKKYEDRIEKQLLAGCLAIKYQEFVHKTHGKNSYSDARSKLLLKPYVPDEFVDKYIDNVSEEELEKQKNFIKEEKIYKKSSWDI